MKPYNGFSHDQRMAAFRWLKKEYENGNRQPPTVCDCCGQDKGIIEAHSEDYSAPYGAHIGKFGLCYICHMMIHCRFSNQRAWEAYRERIRNGYQYEPFTKRNFPKFVQLFLKPPHPEPAIIREPPTSFPLDEIEEGLHKPKHVG